MKNIIKQSLLRIVFVTGAAIILSALYCAITDTGSIDNKAVFQILAANTVIIIGLNLTKKFESTYAILEYLLDTGYTIMVLVLSGLIFDWYSSIPIWYLVFMGIAIYICGVIINIVRNHNELKEITKILKKRKEERTNTVT
jgi:MinD-like ATPase involved in chromosome partitioning or flagellar assembly